MSFYFGLLAALLVSTSVNAGNLKIEFAGIPAEKLKRVRVEVLEGDGQQAKVAFRNDAATIPQEGLALPPGNYQVYLEDRETGLIVHLEATGTGYRVREQGEVHADAADFGLKAREIKDKDQAERRVKSQQLKERQGKKAVFAVGAKPPAGDLPEVGNSVPEPEYASGELLIKYQPDTTLADRYQFIQELNAENRSKLDQLDVYRVKVSAATDLQATVQRFAADPRIKYIETNMVVSVPAPVESGR